MDGEFIRSAAAVTALVLTFIKGLEFCNGIRDRLQHDIRKELDELLLKGATAAPPGDPHRRIEHLRRYYSNLSYDLKSAHIIMALILAVVAVGGLILFVRNGTWLGGMFWFIPALLLTGVQTANIAYEWRKLAIIRERFALLE